MCFFYKQKTAYVIRISDCSSDVCSSDLEHNGLIFSAPLEVLEQVMMGARSRVPLVRGHLGSALYGERVIFGRETVEIRAHDASRWQGIFGIREYPALTRPGQMNRSEEHTSELRSLMRISYAVFCLKQKK